MSPALAGGFLITVPSGKHHFAVFFLIVTLDIFLSILMKFSYVLVLNLNIIMYAYLGIVISSYRFLVLWYASSF